MSPTPTNAAVTPGGPRTRTLLLIGGLIVALPIALKNPVVFVLLLTDGLPAALILAGGSLGGLAVVPLLRLGKLPLRWQVMLGVGLGLGLLSIAVLALGLAGVLNRAVWITILAIAAGAGLVRLRTLLSDGARQPAGASPGHLRWLWLLVCPFLALTILVASVPPGYLWAEEGNGYDVLEYHLEMPKEYLAAGEIAYAPHNVYANFPANVEMLYLLCMVLTGDAIDAAGACKMLNAGLAGLIVAAAWLIGRGRSPTAGMVTAVVAAGVGWLTYLSGIAYVENGMLLWGLLSMAALLRAFDEQAGQLRWTLAAGLLAGFCLGCKYTAMVMVGLPLAVGLLVGLRGTISFRLTACAVFLLAQAAAFTPWAVKNIAMTGNPVFPLAGGVFTHEPPGWGQPESAHFADAHRPGPDQRGARASLVAFWRHLAWDGDERTGLKLRFGWLISIMSIWGLIHARSGRAVRAAGIIMLAQVLLWMTLTHLYARFAVPLLIPMLVLAGRVPLDGTRARLVVVSLIVVGTLANLGLLTRLYAHHMCPQGRRFNIEGATALFTDGLGLAHQHLAVINHQLPPDARILMVGDAKAFYFRRSVDYCVVFNRGPFVTAIEAAAGPSEVLAWLADEGYTHVLVNWAEIDRLRASRYGFPEAISRNLFHRLSLAGLTRTHQFTTGPSQKPYATLHRVEVVR